ncbi:MAG: molecular chaperone [Halobacteria archaeon]|nr:molecular chaperone [Halobacteria archaeon]
MNSIPATNPATSTAETTTQVSFPENEATTEEQQYRAGAYGLLAALLRSPPEQALLDHVAELAAIGQTNDELALAMSMLGLAAKDSSPESLDAEYHALFIGLGRGELVPFGSWYLTGFLMEKPLAVLRDDLAMLGFERHSDTHEPEDHVAALSEVMAMLISDGQDLSHQANFFAAHLAPWVDRFFTDLSTAKNAVFYRAVGRFGTAFVEFERDYLSMNV